MNLAALASGDRYNSPGTLFYLDPPSRAGSAIGAQGEIARR
jgi:hypothetical protein